MLISPTLEQLAKPAALVQQLLWATATESLLVYIGLVYLEPVLPLALAGLGR